MKKIFLKKCIISLGLLLFFTFLPQIIPTHVNIAQASEFEKEKNNETRLNLKALTLVNGKSFTLRVYNIDKDAKVSFTSADPDIASVTEDGIIIGNKLGSTTITATVRKGLTTTPLTCDVTVGPPAFSVKLTRSRVILELDQVTQLEALIKPISTVESVKFLSQNSTIASVSTGGRVTAKELGMTFVLAKIDAINQDGTQKFSTCSVIVSKPEDVLKLYDYFALHPELNDIPEAELSNALFEIINGYYSIKNVTDNSTITTVTSEAQKGQNAAIATASPNSADIVDDSTDTSNKSTDETTKEPTPGLATNTLQANRDNSDSSTVIAENELSLIETLDRQLNSRFNLAELRRKYDERFQMLTLIQSSSLHRLKTMIKK